jgi:hypothetical protein
MRNHAACFYIQLLYFSATFFHIFKSIFIPFHICSSYISIFKNNSFPSSSVHPAKISFSCGFQVINKSITIPLISITGAHETKAKTFVSVFIKLLPRINTRVCTNSEQNREQSENKQLEMGFFYHMIPSTTAATRYE